MKEPDSLDTLLREWKSPEPTEEMEQLTISAYRSLVSPARVQHQIWRRFLTMRVSIPAPALLAAALAICALFVWLRPSPAPPKSPEVPGAVTQVNASGFLPLPNGEARVIPAMEIRK